MRTRGYKVLIVEDCEEFARALKLLVEGLHGYQVIGIAGNGKDVVNHPLLNKADLILMDVNMPVLDGISAGKKINFLFPDLKMVAITLNKDLVYLEELIHAGFKGFIDKQSIVEDLAKVLKEVLNNRYVFPRNLLLNRELNNSH